MGLCFGKQCGVPGPRTRVTCNSVRYDALPCLPGADEEKFDVTVHKLDLPTLPHKKGQTFQITVKALGLPEDTVARVGTAPSLRAPVSTSFAEEEIAFLDTTTHVESAQPFITADGGGDDNTRAIFRCEPLNWLPPWSYDSEVATLAQDRHVKGGSPRRGTKIAYSEIAGPPVRWGYLSALVMWSFFLFSPWPALKFTRCGNAASPFASYPMWLYCCFVPILFCLLTIEWLCLRYVIVVQVLWAGAFRIFGVTLSYVEWLVVMIVSSIISHLDIVSQNLLTVTLVKTLQCDTGTMVNAAWRQKSTFSTIPGLDNVAVAAASVWSLTLLQLVWAIIASVPIGAADFSIGTKEGKHYKFQTIMTRCDGRLTYLNDAMDVLALTNRMVSVSFRSTEQRLQRACNYLDGTPWLELGQVKATEKYLAQLEPEIRKCALRFLLFVALETGFKLEIQMSVFIIERAFKPEDIETRIPLVLSVSVALGTLVSSVYQWLQFRQYQLRVARPSDVDGDARWLGINKWLSLFALVIVFFSVVLLHCGVHITMAIICEEKEGSFQGLHDAVGP